MKKMKIKLTQIFGAIALRAAPKAFCNIAEGTHAGSITMVAGETVGSSNLLVKAANIEGEVLIAGVSDKPIGVCTDEASKGETIAVSIPGCAESTFICIASSDVSMGDNLYTAAGGKVSTLASDGCRKVGIALCSATTGGVVEIDPQGFGERAWQICACGTYTWKGSTANETLTHSEIKSTDFVFGAISASAGSEKNVKSTAQNGSIGFALDANGTASSTKINWIAIRKN